MMNIFTKCKKGRHFTDAVVCAACDKVMSCSKYVEMFLENPEEITNKIIEYTQKYKKYKMEVFIVARPKKETSSIRETGAKKKVKEYIVITDKKVLRGKTESEIVTMFETGQLDIANCKLVPEGQLYRPILKLTIVKD